MTLDDFLGRFDRKTATGGQWLVRCPAHDDRKASLAVREGREGRILLTCHAGCQKGAVVRALGLTDSDLFEDPKRSSRREVATYDYCAEDGTLLYQVVRYEPKDFRQRRPDGKGGWIWNLDGVRRVVYRLPQLKSKEAVVICEGEKDVEALRAQGVPATCNVAGAGKWRDEYTHQIAAAGVQRVAITPDNDPAGVAHGDLVARSCHAAGLSVRFVTLPGVDAKGDVSDYLRKHTKDELLALIREAQAFDPSAAPPAPPAPVAGPMMVNLADVKPEQISWLWPGRLARGKVAIIAGDPGVGKSFVTIDIASRITTATAWPDGRPAPERASVIFLAAEDGLADTVRPRLDAMGGDASRVHVLQGVRAQGAGEVLEERGFSLQTDLIHLEAAITKTAAALVVIDPISNYLGDTDSYRDTEVRQVLTPLAQLAERTGVAILLVMHLTKDTKASALYRLNSSIAFGGVARLVLAVGTDPDEPNPYVVGATRIVANVKQNIVCDPPAVPWSFRTASNRVEWIAAREDVRPDTLFASHARPVASGSVADVDAFLFQLLGEGDYWPVKEIELAAKEQGISRDRLYRRRVELCETKRHGGVGGDGHWESRLKPEHRTAPRFASTLPPLDTKECSKGCTPPDSAFLVENETATPDGSMTSSKNAGSAILAAALGGDGWTEI